MGYLNITNIEFQKGHERVSDPFVLEVKFDCLKDIDNEVEWRFVYVVDPDNSAKDQVLDQIFMDRLEYGVNNFDWEVSPPDYSKLSNPFDVLDTTVIMIEVLIEGREFFRCSYFLTHTYDSEELEENPPEEIAWDHLLRKINATNPVITVKEIAWEELKSSSKENPQLVSDSNDPRFQAFDMLAAHK